MFKSRDYASNSQAIIKFTTLFGVNILSCFKHFPLNLNLIFELFIQSSYREKLLFALTECLFFTFDNALDVHSAIAYGRIANVVRVK